MADAEAPRMVNTTVNPAMNARIPRSSRCRSFRRSIVAGPRGVDAGAAWALSGPGTTPTAPGAPVTRGAPVTPTGTAAGADDGAGATGALRALSSAADSPETIER